MKRAIMFVIILATAFTVMGVTVGVAMEKEYGVESFSRMAEDRSPAGPEGRPERPKAAFGRARILKRISRQLNLTEEQKLQVKEILENGRQNATAARTEFQNRLQEIRKNSNSEILAILDAEQREKFEQITSRAEARKSQMPGRRRSRPGRQRFLPGGPDNQPEETDEER